MPQKQTEICATCWYAGRTAGYRDSGKNRRPLLLCRRSYELHEALDSCPRYLSESRGHGGQGAQAF